MKKIKREDMNKPDMKRMKITKQLKREQNEKKRKEMESDTGYRNYFSESDFLSKK